MIIIEVKRVGWEKLTEITVLFQNMYYGRLIFIYTILLSNFIQVNSLKELDVCVVPHTHLDLGWKRSFEVSTQYTSLSRDISQRWNAL